MCQYRASGIIFGCNHFIPLRLMERLLSCDNPNCHTSDAHRWECPECRLTCQQVYEITWCQPMYWQTGRCPTCRYAINMFGRTCDITTKPQCFPPINPLVPAIPITSMTPSPLTIAVVAFVGTLLIIIAGSALVWWYRMRQPPEPFSNIHPIPMTRTERRRGIPRSRLLDQDPSCRV